MADRRPTHLLAAALVVALSVAPALAADVPAWLSVLKLQIKEANGCDVVEVLHSRDVTVGDNVGTEGRLRCVDSREYDFTRPNPHQKFTFRLCQPAVC